MNRISEAALFIERGGREIDVALCGAQLGSVEHTGDSLLIDIQPIVKVYSVSLN